MNFDTTTDYSNVAKALLSEFPDKAGYNKAVFIDNDRPAVLYIPNTRRRNIHIAQDYVKNAEYIGAFILPIPNSTNNAMFGRFENLETRACIFLPLYEVW